MSSETPEEMDKSRAPDELIQSTPDNGKYREPRKIEKMINDLKNEDDSLLEDTVPPEVKIASTTPENRFDRYVKTTRIGAGGSSIVYKAYDTKLKRYVALKILKITDKGPVTNFHKEAEIIASLKHPNIVPIFDTGTFNNQHYISMQYIEGNSLDMLSGKLKYREYVSLIINICNALYYIHSKGIIHRDIKPQNIILGTNNIPILVDFGIAKSYDKLSSKNKEIIGTPPFISPEIIQHNQYDKRSDIFSLGVTLYNVLTDVNPFDGNSVNEVVVNILEKEPPPIKRFNSEVPYELELIIKKCTEKDPSLRYQKADELEQELTHFLQKKPTTAIKSHKIYSLIKTLSTYTKISVIILIIICGAATTTFLIYNHLLSRSESAKSDFRKQSLTYQEQGKSLLNTVINYRNGTENHSIQQWLKESVVLLTKAIESDPANNEAYSLRADAQKRLGNFRGAINDYTKIIESNLPYSLTARFNRMVLCYRFTYCATYLNMKSKGLTVGINQGIPNSLYESFKGMIYEDIDSLMESYASPAHPFCASAIKNLIEGNLDGAIIDFNEAINRAPGLSDAHLLSGVAKFFASTNQINDNTMRLRLQNESLKDVETAIEIDPNSLHPYIASSMIIYVNKGLEKVLEHIEKAKRINESHLALLLIETWTRSELKRINQEETDPN